MAKNKNLLKNIFFVGLSLKLFWYILFRKFFNWNIFVFDNFENPASHSEFLLKLHKKKWITRVSEHGYAFYNSHTTGIELANSILNKNSDNLVFALASEFYKSKETDLVFKRIIAQNISLLSAINKFIMYKSNIINPSLFISSKFKKILKDYPEIINKSVSVRYDFNWEVLKLKMTWLLMISAYITHLFVKNFCKKNRDKKVFKYGISIPFPWITKFTGAREFTYLVDDKIIKKSETVFLIEYPESKNFYKHYSDKGYNLKDATNINKIRKLFSSSNLNTFQETLKIIKLFMVKKYDFFIYESLIFLLYNKLSLSIVHDKVSFLNYIYTNKESGLQIAANIFMKEKKIKVHAYSMFIGGQYQICGSDSVYDDRHVIWSFLNPNYFYLNCKAMVNSMSLHHQENIHYKIIGNIFSEKIREIRRNTKHIHDIKFNFNLINSKKIISIFDTSYVDISKSYSNFEEGVCFIKDAIKLAKNTPNCIFLFKPSKNISYFLSGYWTFDNGVEIVKLREKFNKLSNAIMLSDHDDVIDVISISDLVITNSFSSPTADALLAGVPAFWYQARSNVSFSVYNKIPGLVVVGLENLVIKVNEMLQDDYTLEMLNNPNFIDLVGTSNKALTSLRLNLSNEQKY